MQDTVLSHELNLLEIYCQTCTYDTGNNLTHLSHQANSSTWQQNLTVHPNNNRGTAGLSVVFTAFAQNVGADVQGVGLLFCLVGLSYYGARYLAPWLARWISPDSAGAVDGLNLYAYVGNIWAWSSNSKALDCRWLVSW
jgi:uncharacterized protein RhaS with RHS repeats